MVFIVVRQIPIKTLITYQIDKFAHIIVSFCLTAFVYPFARVFCQDDRIKKFFILFRRYWNNESLRVKELTLVFVLGAVIGWEIAEYFGIKPVMYYGIPGMRSGVWDYALDTMIDILADVCGVVWYLYLMPELFSSSENPTP